MRTSRRGNILTLVVLSLSSLLGFGALVVDVGYLRICDAQLQMAADAATHAGASQLDGSWTGVQEGRAAAIELALLNEVNGQPLLLDVDDGDLDWGYWDWDLGEFVESSEVDEITAAYLELEMDDISPFFAGASFGIDALQVDAKSVSVKPPAEPAGAVECFMPIAVPSCAFTDNAEGDWNYLEFTFNSDGDDNIGWAYIGGSPNAKNVRSQMENCDDSGEVQITSSVELNNGVLTSALRSLANMVEDSDTAWDSSVWGRQPSQNSKSAIASGYYGNTFEGPVIIFEAGDCDNVKFNGEATITGFAWGAVYDVVATGRNKNVRMRLETTDEYDFGTAGGGSVDAGVTYQPPTMIVH